jgi:hypothetical protein
MGFRPNSLASNFERKRRQKPVSFVISLPNNQGDCWLIALLAKRPAQKLRECSNTVNGFYKKNRPVLQLSERPIKTRLLLTR